MVTSTEWGLKKRKIWKVINGLLCKNSKFFENLIDEYKNDWDIIYNEVIAKIQEFLKKKTDLLDDLYIESQNLDVSGFIPRFILAIFLMNLTPLPYKSDIYKLTNLDYKFISEIADFLGKQLPKKSPGAKIDPDILKNILAALDKEIKKYNAGLEPSSVNEIAEGWEITQSKVTYYGNIHRVAEYKEIWGRDEDWNLSDELCARILNRFREEIKKFNNDQNPESLNSIYQEFKNYTCYATVRNLLIEQFPDAYQAIWRSNYRLTQEQKEQLFSILDIEANKNLCASLTAIGKKLGIPFDMVRYYAIKQYPNRYNDLWGQPQLTEEEKQKIKEHIQRQYKKHDKYKQGVITYNRFQQRFDITRNNQHRPDPLNQIAQQFNRSRHTITRLAREVNSERFDKIYAKYRINEDTVNAIELECLNFNSGLNATNIAKKYKVSLSAVCRISIQRVDSKYDGYEHNKRFPQDLCQQLGTVFHSIIQSIKTRHMLDNDIFVFSEIPSGNRVIDILMPHDECQKFYEKLISDNEERLDLWKNIGIDLEKYDEIIFELTSFVSKKYFTKKGGKYFAPNRFIFVVGTRWYYENYPKPIIRTQFPNIVGIRHDVFAELIGLSGTLLREFEDGIKINYEYDLDKMKSLKNKITGKYLKFGYDYYQKYLG